MNLDERAVMLHRKCTEAKITGSYVGRLYKRYKIKIMAVVLKKIVSKKYRSKQLDHQEEAKKQLDDCFKKVIKICYLDECMFTV